MENDLFLYFSLGVSALALAAVIFGKWARLGRCVGCGIVAILGSAVALILDRTGTVPFRFSVEDPSMEELYGAAPAAFYMDFAVICLTFLAIELFYYFLGRHAALRELRDSKTVKLCIAMLSILVAEAFFYLDSVLFRLPITVGTFLFLSLFCALCSNIVRLILVPKKFSWLKREK